MARLKPADIPLKTALRVEIKVHIIEGGRVTYDRRHSVRDDDAFPNTTNGLRWIHIPSNDMDLVEVSLSCLHVV
jgi:hypothetical protein